MSAAERSFPLATMSPLFSGLTLFLWLVPPAFLAGTAFGMRELVVPGLLLIAIYAWVWLRFRPTRFVVRPDVVEVIWPMKRRQLQRAEISSVRIIDRHALRRECGRCLRVGAGGLWGGFGWLWTEQRGIVQMYISRADGLVWIERGRGRSWLITPEKPEAFVGALSR